MFWRSWGTRGGERAPTDRQGCPFAGGTMTVLGLLTAGLAVGGVLASLALELLARPSAAGLRRPVYALLIHAGLFLAAWSLLWLASGRPGFAAALTLAGQFLTIAVGNAKYRALREPFVFTDFGLFSQALRFPRLYLPFLGVTRAVAAAVGLGSALALGLFVEGPWPGGRALAGALLVGALPLLWIGSHLAAPVRLDPVADLRAIGLFVSLWLYWLAERRPAPALPARPWLDASATRARPKVLPDLVLVQSESFFDVRRLYPGVEPALLERFDALRGQARMHGLLTVPAWGANTMRTEFAVLSGLPEDALGVHRFNPYRRFARGGLPGLPQALRARGYRTVCIHPHPAGFFGRDQVFPSLGFDQFIDLDGFADAPRDGPYVSDAAVTRKIAEVLEASDGPTFVFVITMENHGPLHLERVGPGDVARFYRTPPPPGWEDLTVYLRHLGNADRMFGALADLLAARPRGGLMCLFGDHVPSMPAVYDDLGFADPRTDYLVWPAAGVALGRLDLAAWQLSEALLAALDGVGSGPAGIRRGY